jgi:hypothetical protein
MFINTVAIVVKSHFVGLLKSEFNIQQTYLRSENVKHPNWLKEDNKDNKYIGNVFWSHFVVLL